MDRARIQAIGVGVGLTALVATPFYLMAQPPMEAPRAHVAEPAARPPAADRAAPAVALTSFKGQPWRLADLRDKKAALMVFWASW